MKFYFMVALMFFAIGYMQAEEEAKEAKEELVFAPALAKATKENKSVFLLFTDRDGCGSCNMMESAILKTPEFIEYTSKKLIYLELDYSAAANGGTEENQKLFVDYGVESFPTLLLVDNQGLPYQRFQYKGQSKIEFIAEIEKALGKKELKTKFLNSKDEEVKKKIAAEFIASREPGENFIFFAEVIAFGVLNDSALKAEEKIKKVGDLYIYSKEEAFVANLSQELKKLDPEKKLGSARLFVIREFITLIMAEKDDKAFEYFLANKANFKGDDLGYLYQFGTHLVQIGKPEKMVEIIAFILSDDEIKKNEESVSYLTDQMNSLKKAKSKEAEAILPLKEEAKKDESKTDEKLKANSEQDKPK